MNKGLLFFFFSPFLSVLFFFHENQKEHTSFGHVMILGKFALFSRWPLTMASMMLGWSDPRLTKTWLMPASPRDSKKAKEVVYMPGGEADE